MVIISWSGTAVMYICRYIMLHWAMSIIPATVMMGVLDMQDSLCVAGTEISLLIFQFLKRHMHKILNCILTGFITCTLLQV
jgi:hypothetical protein